MIGLGWNALSSTAIFCLCGSTRFRCTARGVEFGSDCVAVFRFRLLSTLVVAAEDALGILDTSDCFFLVALEAADVSLELEDFRRVAVLVLTAATLLILKE